MSDIFAQVYPQIWPLFSIHPYEQAELFIVQSIGRVFENEQMALLQIKSSVGRSRIQTQQLKDNQWKVWVDKYDYVFEFNYDFESAKMSLSAVWKRIADSE